MVLLRGPSVEVWLEPQLPIWFLYDCNLVAKLPPWPATPRAFRPHQQKSARELVRASDRAGWSDPSDGDTCSTPSWTTAHASRTRPCATVDEWHTHCKQYRERSIRNP